MFGSKVLQIPGLEDSKSALQHDLAISTSFLSIFSFDVVASVCFPSSVHDVL
jgi:hypothetical protein